jgi:glycosyltransferase involved in cell wall biosynthesis
MPVYATDLSILRQTIASIEAQLYPNWQLCIVDDASPDPA